MSAVALGGRLDRRDGGVIGSERARERERVIGFRSGERSVREADATRAKLARV